METLFALAMSMIAISASTILIFMSVDHVMEIYTNLMKVQTDHMRNDEI